MKRIVLLLTVALLVLMNVRMWATYAPYRVSAQRQMVDEGYLTLKSDLEKAFAQFKKSSACNGIGVQQLVNLLEAERALVDSVVLSKPCSVVSQAKKYRDSLLNMMPEVSRSVYSSIMNVATRNKQINDRLAQSVERTLAHKHNRLFLKDVNQALARYDGVVKSFVQDTPVTMQHGLATSVDVVDAQHVGQCTPIIWE